MKKNNLLDSFKSPIVILLLVGLVVRICLFFMYQPYNHLDEVIVSDAEGYHLIALNLIDHGSFVVPNSILDTIRTPVYPLFLAFVYSIFGVNISIVILFQQLLCLASVFLLYKIGEKLFNKKTGLIAAVIFCFEPDHIYFSFDLLTDTLFVFLLLWSTLFFIHFLKEKSIQLLIISSFIIGLATLTRPISLFIPVVGIFIIAIDAIKHKESWYKVIKRSALLSIVFILAISPWSIRNKIKYDSYSLSAISGLNLLNYNTAFTIKRKSTKSISEIRDDLYQNRVLMKGDSIKMTNNNFYLSDIQKQVAIEYIKDNKWEYIKANTVGIFNLYTSLGYKAFLDRFIRIENRAGHDADFDKVSASWERFKSMSPLYLSFAIVYILYLLFLYCLSCVGLYSLFKYKKLILLLSLLSIIGYFTLLTGVVGLSRYKLPISPYYILFATTGLIFLIERMKKQSNKKSI